MANDAYQLPPIDFSTRTISDDLTMGATTRPESRGRLRKPLPTSNHGRSVLAQISSLPDFSHPSPHELQLGYSPHIAHSPLSPLQPPPPIAEPRMDSRSSSLEARSRPPTPSNYSRPTTPALVLPDQADSASSSPSNDRRKVRKSSGWFAKHNSSNKDGSEERRSVAWIAGHPQRPAYDVTGLMNGRPVPELWDDQDGNCLVYLFPHSTGKGPSFKVDRAVFASSSVLTRLALGDIISSGAVQPVADRRQLPLDVRTHSLTLHDAPPATSRQRHAVVDSTSSASSQGSRGRLSNLSEPPAELHLYLPIKFRDPQNMQAPMLRPPRPNGDPNNPAMQDLQTLIDIRNLFAFLKGQSLVASESKHTFFHIFMVIAAVLRSYEFTNLDGSTFGEVASSSFDDYVEELRLADVRTSREKTIEGIVLGERMKSVLLYNEAFTHGAGKLNDLVNLKSPKFGLLSSVTDNRLIRASMDLDKRIHSVELILNDFDFPALFTGIMASKTSEERKDGVRFENWKDGFLGFRKNYLGMLKNRYGDWPPKAKSKKNDLETSGLNRLVLRDLYNDMTAVYDLLVDRTSLTTRTVDGVTADAKKEESTIRALRVVLSEYDRSSPPVKPPMPFDLPILPKLTNVRPDFGQDKKKDLKTISKKLRDDDISQILLHSWNRDVLARPSPFLQAFWEIEKRAAHGSTIAELVDLRIGQWIFMYVVLQALPMLACDAPGVKWTQGVEYFLCEPPRKGVPWAQNPNQLSPSTPASTAAPGVGRTWFAVGEGLNVVSLPADVVEHGVEGIYHRSHCWMMAERWTQNDTALHTALHEQEALNRSLTQRHKKPERPLSRYDPTGGSGRSTPDLLWPAQPGQSMTANGFLAPTPPNRPQSRNSGLAAGKRNSSLSLGLEALPLPMGIVPGGSTGMVWQSPGGAGTPVEQQQKRMSHAVDASKTFDAILAGVGTEGKRGKKNKN